jgi:hypothetical protein
MSLTIDTAFVNNYRNVLYERVRQQGSLLRNAVRVESVKPGEQAFFELINNSAAVPMGARHSNTPFTPSEHTRRSLAIQGWVWNDYIDELDKCALLIDPTSAYIKGAMDSLSARMDLIIIGALTGSANSGHLGTTAVTLPATQIITSGAAGMTLDKMRSAKYKLDRKRVPPKNRFLALTAKGMQDLLGDPNVTSADFNTVKALVDGTLNTYMGFTIIQSEYLTKTLPGMAASETQAIAWQQDGIVLGMAEDIFGKVTELPERNYSYQAYARMSLGAVRLEEERVVRIDYLEPDNT